MSQKQVMPKSEDLSKSLEINAIWTFDTEFPTIFNKLCTYITFMYAVKHRQLSYGYPRGQTVHLLMSMSLCNMHIHNELLVTMQFRFFIFLKPLRGIVSFYIVCECLLN